MNCQEITQKIKELAASQEEGTMIVRNKDLAGYREFLLRESPLFYPFFAADFRVRAQILAGVCQKIKKNKPHDLPYFGKSGLGSLRLPNGKSILLDFYGRIINDKEFEDIRFSDQTGEPTFAVEDKKYHFIDKYGKQSEQLPGDYDRIILEDPSVCLACVRKDGKSYFIDQSGDKISSEYDDTYGFQNKDFACVRNNKQFFLIDKNFQRLGEEYATSVIHFHGFPIAFTSDGKTFFVGENGQRINEEEYDHFMGTYFQEDLLAVTQGDDSFYINKKGEKVSKNFQKALDFNGGIAPVLENGKLQFIDKNFESVDGGTYDQTGAYNKDFATVKIGDKWFILNHETRLLSSKGFKEIDVSKSGVIWVLTQGGWQEADVDGHTFSDSFDSINFFNEGIDGVIMARLGGQNYLQYIKTLSIKKNSFDTAYGLPDIPSALKVKEDIEHLAIKLTEIIPALLLAEKIKLREQYDSQLNLLRDNNILQKLSDGSEGIIGIDGEEYSVPKYIEIVSRMKKDSLDFFEKNIDGGFKKLLLIPFGVSINSLVEKYKNLILHSDDNGRFMNKLNDRPIYIDKTDPVRVKDDLIDSDTTGDLIYSLSPQNNGSKLELIGDGFAWQVVLSEDITYLKDFSIARPYIYKEKNQSYREFAQKMWTHKYAGISGQIPETWLIYAMTCLTEGKGIIDKGGWSDRLLFTNCKLKTSPNLIPFVQRDDGSTPDSPHMYLGLADPGRCDPPRSCNRLVLPL